MYLKELEGNKESKKRKAHRQNSSQPFKKRRKNEKLGHSEINTTEQSESKK